MPRTVKINLVRMIIEFATALENSNGIRRLADDEGNIVVPVDRFGDFCHDMGIILGRVIEQVSAPGE